MGRPFRQLDSSGYMPELVILLCLVKNSGDVDFVSVKMLLKRLRGSNNDFQGLHRLFHIHVGLRKGMMSACRSVFFTLVLLVLVTYVFSITITEISRGTRLEEELFPGMGYTIITLIVQCVMPDLESRFKDAAYENWFVGALWLTFIMFGTYIMMGLLVP